MIYLHIPDLKFPKLHPFREVDPRKGYLILFRKLGVVFA